MKLTDKGGGDFEPAPAGTHIARCMQVIDVGTQHWVSAQYGEKTARKIRLTFELPYETKVFDEAKGEQPIFVSGEFTASLNERATLRGLLAGWRGHDFTAEELAGFEARNLLDKVAMVTLVHETKNGKTYANINSVSKLPKGKLDEKGNPVGPQYDCPPAINPLIYFSLDPEEFDADIYDGLPEWLRKKIAESDEFKAIMANPTTHTAGLDGWGDQSPSDQEVDENGVPF